MTDLTDFETKQDMIARMGNELGEYYYLLFCEIAWVHASWAEYVELFGTSPERVNLLNEASGHFAYLLSNMMLDDAMLHVARLTDAPKVAGHHTLTVRRLPNLVAKANKNAVQSALNTVENKAEFCREWRNNYIAHRNLAVAKNTRATPLPPRTRTAMSEALAALTDLMNVVNRAYSGGDIWFKTGMLDGAIEILYVLEDGITLRRERQEQIAKGDFSSIRNLKRRL